MFTCQFCPATKIVPAGAFVAHRNDHGFFDFLQRPLSFRIEFAYRINLVAEKFHAHRKRHALFFVQAGGWRVKIQNASARRKFADATDRITDRDVEANSRRSMMPLATTVAPISAHDPNSQPKAAKAK